MTPDISAFGIRRIGIAFCFARYKAVHNRYPENKTELLEVTSTNLTEAQFKKYRDWYLKIAESDVE